MKAIALVIFLLLCKNIFAQYNDTLKINTVEIFDINNTNKLNSNTSSNLGNLLKTQSAVFVKDYSPGMLSTISQRGLGANHTNLLWEGINIQNPMLGINDLTLLPTNAFTEINSISGSSGYLNSNGAFGGSINLQSTTPQTLIIKANTQYNFYNNLSSNISIENNLKKFWLRYQLFNTSGKNNYTYLNKLSGKEIIEKQSHAAMHLSGQIFEIGAPIGKYFNLSFKNWLQVSNRQIPSPLGINNNSEKQKDYNNRSILKATYFNRKIYLVNTFALLNDSINYFNPKASGNADTSLSYSRSFKNNLNTIYNIHQNIIFKTGLQSEFNKGNTQQYVKTNNYTAQNYIYLTPNIRYKLFTFSPTYKLAHYSISNKLYHIYNLNAEVNLFNKLNITANYGKNYRFPTLNDLYWLPGGNPNLLPEEGILSDLNFTLHPFTGNKSYLKYNLYNNTVNNYIVWLPGNNSYFTPQNLKQIWSRGFELEAYIEYNKKNLLLSNRSMYAYTKSTNKKSAITNDESIGRQLLYTPIYNVKNIFSITFKNTGLFNEYTLASWRAVSTDNYDYLSWYQVFNFGIFQKFSFKKNSLTISVAINNAFNQHYEIIKYRPMPLRNYSLSLSYQFTK